MPCLRISDPYEAPENPEMRIDTRELTPNLAAHRILIKLESLGFIRQRAPTRPPTAAGAEPRPCRPISRWSQRRPRVMPTAGAASHGSQYLFELGILPGAEWVANWQAVALPLASLRLPQCPIARVADRRSGPFGRIAPVVLHREPRAWRIASSCVEPGARPAFVAAARGC